MNSTISKKTKKKLIFKFDARFKLLLLILTTVIVWIPAGFTGLFFLITPIVFIWFLSGLQFKTFLKSFLYVLFFSTMIFTINLFFSRPPNGEVWHQVNSSTSVVLYAETISNTLDTFIRLFILMLSSLIFCITTEANDISKSVRWLIYPLSYLKVNIDTASIMVMLSFRFIPIIANEMNGIVDSNEIRGGGARTGNIAKKVSSYIKMIVPVFIVSFKQIEYLSQSLESKNYSSNSKRTTYKKLHFELIDFIIFSILFSIAVIYILLAIFGNGEFIPLFLDGLFI